MLGGYMHQTQKLISKIGLKTKPMDILIHLHISGFHFKLKNKFVVDRKMKHGAFFIFAVYI